MRDAVFMLPLMTIVSDKWLENVQRESSEVCMFNMNGCHLTAFTSCGIRTV